MQQRKDCYSLDWVMVSQLISNERQYAILNADDDGFTNVQKLTAAQVITYGIENECDVRATKIRMYG